jgi:8-amino-7-oxononanoate synthase
MMTDDRSGGPLSHQPSGISHLETQMSDPLAWIDDEAAAWEARGLTRRLVPHGGAGPGRFTRDGRVLVDFGSNDYLGLAADPRLARAATDAAEVYGWGAGASPLITGWTEVHQQLADALAEFEGAEAAAIFPTGFAANLGTIPALVGPGDLVYSDRLNHASLIDGCRQSRAEVRVYPHADAHRLGHLLAEDRGRFRRALIVTDGVFSMDGDLAPLAELADLAERFGAMLMVDEAHGTAVFGPDGRGAGSVCGVAERIPIKVGTLSKALGSLGGFVAGSRSLIAWLVNHARPLIFSTALPPPAAAAALEAVTIAESEPWRRERVQMLGRRLGSALAELGYRVGTSPGPIVPVVVGTPDRAIRLASRLFDAGLFAPAIRPPTVPEGTSRIRITLSAAHSDDDVKRLIGVMADAL